MKKFLIILGIILVTVIAAKDTLDNYKELNKISVYTPAQWGIRQPAQQNPGQSQTDIKNQQNENKNYNKIWDNDSRNYGNNLDKNYQNPNRIQQNKINKFINR